MELGFGKGRLKIPGVSFDPRAEGLCPPWFCLQALTSARPLQPASPFSSTSPHQPACVRVSGATPTRSATTAEGAAAAFRCGSTQPRAIPMRRWLHSMLPLCQLGLLPSQWCLLCPAWPQCCHSGSLAEVSLLYQERGSPKPAPPHSSASSSCSTMGLRLPKQSFLINLRHI